MTPYRPLELAGRDVYRREGCYTCHSQMIRPFRFESLRYGPVSRIEDSMYDHPFQWGSKRTGPDLAREGGRNPNLWHYRHMMDPRSTSVGSNMPSYAHLATEALDYSEVTDTVRAMQSIGVPYSDAQVRDAASDARVQAREIADDLRTGRVRIDPDTQLVALIAYLQRLGRYTPSTPSSATAPAAPTAGGAR